MTDHRSERHYDEPPLSEAVFELFAEPSSAEIDANAFFGRFEQFSAERQEWRNAVVAMEVRDGRLVSQSFREAANGERRWNGERTRGVLVGPGVIAFNVLPPYGHFVDHRPTLSDLLTVYLETARPKALHWAGHRYINRVRADSKTLPTELFAIYPGLPDDLAAEHPPFSIQVEAARFDGGVVVASLGLAHRTEDEATYVLDLYARSPQPFPGGSVDEILAWHDRAHEAVVEGFEMAITDAARRLFKEKKDEEKK